MAFLKQFADDVWSYVSPNRPETSLPTPDATPPRPAEDLRRVRYNLRERPSRLTGALTPATPLTGPVTPTPLVATGNRRKRPRTPSTDGSDLPRKVTKTKSLAPAGLRHSDGVYVVINRDVQTSDDDEQNDVGNDNDDHDHDHDQSDDSEDDWPLLYHYLAGLRARDLAPPGEDDGIKVEESGEQFFDDADDEREGSTYDEVNDRTDHDDAGLINIAVESTENNASATAASTNQSTANSSTDDPPALDWDDDHKALLQSLDDLGREPILPQSWRPSFPSLPDALFTDDDEYPAYFGSASLPSAEAEQALRRFLAHAGWTRGPGPVARLTRELRAYARWALRDSRLHPRRAIPTLALVIKRPDVPEAVVRATVSRRLARLAARWTAAFAAVLADQPSLARWVRMPTLYALVVAAPRVSLVAYRPDDPRPQPLLAAVFDFAHPALEPWSLLALAVVVVHARYVLLYISEMTEIGDWRTDDSSLSDSDPDA